MQVYAQPQRVAGFKDVAVRTNNVPVQPQPGVSALNNGPKSDVFFGSSDPDATQAGAQAADAAKAFLKGLIPGRRNRGADGGGSTGGSRNSGGPSTAGVLFKVAKLAASLGVGYVAITSFTGASLFDDPTNNLVINAKTGEVLAKVDRDGEIRQLEAGPVHVPFWDEAVVKDDGSFHDLGNCKGKPDGTTVLTLPGKVDVPLMVVKASKNPEEVTLARPTADGKYQDILTVKGPNADNFSKAQLAGLGCEGIDVK